MLFRSWIALFLVSVILCASVTYALFIYFPHTPLGTINKAITYDLPAGASCKKIAEQLYSQDLFTFSQKQCFCWWIKFIGDQRKLQVGEYEIPFLITPHALLEKFKKGDVIQHTLTIKEGMTIDEVQRILSVHPALKKTIIWDEASVAEGTLFPDTYYFTKNTSDQALLTRAGNLMQAKLNAAWEKRAKECTLKTPYEALILASIIEKETANEIERSIVSGVFQRRLANNMRLQADPTVTYGLRKKRQESLTKEDLKKDTPYNTYFYKGLPPTPIALPGLASIEAALHPDKGETLYFVAKGDGMHQFSVTLQEHNDAVARYRRVKNHE